MLMSCCLTLGALPALLVSEDTTVATSLSYHQRLGQEAVVELSWPFYTVWCAEVSFTTLQILWDASGKAAKAPMEPCARMASQIRGYGCWLIVSVGSERCRQVR